MAKETVLYEKDGVLARVTLNRPDKLNAINDAVLSELAAALERARNDDDIQAIVLKGTGSSFSVGQDLSGLGTSKTLPPDPRTRPYLKEIYEMTEDLASYWDGILHFPKPIIAQVQGYCLGAGCELMMVCHTSIVAEDAVLGDPSIRMGYASGMALWTWKVGLRKAKEMLLTGRYVSGSEAERIGLATVAVPAQELEKEVEIATQAILGAIANSGMVGADGTAVNRLFMRATFERAGLTTAWKYAAGVYALSAVQRRGFAEDEFSFWEARDQKGLKGAIKERDAAFKKLFP